MTPGLNPHRWAVMVLQRAGEGTPADSAAVRPGATERNGGGVQRGFEFTEVINE